jgi:putative ABC transport system permease protein
MLHELLPDLRLGARHLRRSPAFFAAAVLTLAIGIGANTAIGSAVHAILRKPLPHPDPERLMLVWTRLDRVGIDRNGVSPPELVDLAGHDAFEDVAGVYNTDATLSLGDEPERIEVGFVSPSVFPLLRAEAVPRRGRRARPRRRGGAEPSALAAPIRGAARRPGFPDHSRRRGVLRRRRDAA